MLYFQNSQTDYLSSQGLVSSHGLYDNQIKCVLLNSLAAWYFLNGCAVLVSVVCCWHSPSVLDGCMRVIIIARFQAQSLCALKRFSLRDRVQPGFAMIGQRLQSGTCFARPLEFKMVFISMPVEIIFRALFRYHFPWSKWARILRSRGGFKEIILNRFWRDHFLVQKNKTLLWNHFPYQFWARKVVPKF